MLVSQLKQVTAESVPTSNHTLKRYYPLGTSTQEVTHAKAFDAQSLAGYLSGVTVGKTLDSKFKPKVFIDEVLQSFSEVMAESEDAELIKKIYFENGEIPAITPLMNMGKSFNTLDQKTKKAFPIFKQFLKRGCPAENLTLGLNFVENKIFESFEKHLKDQKQNYEGSSYVSYLDEYFTKDFLFILDNVYYFRAHINSFLRFYFFTYSAQLALNLHVSPLEEPAQQKLYFILNNEKASSERKNIARSGYQNLIEKVHYVFPYLSLLEYFSSLLGKDDLKLYHFKQVEETTENFEVLDGFNIAFRSARNLEVTNKHSESVTEAMQGILLSAFAQFQDGSGRKAALGRFVSAFENQVANGFFQSRGRFGKVAVLDQDMILMLTNLIIGTKEKIRFQDLMKGFQERGVCFDIQSEESLLDLYERVGNIERKSDSGDAVYVKTTI